MATPTITTTKPNVTDFIPGKKSVTKEDLYPLRPQQSSPESSESPTQAQYAWHLYMLRLNIEHLSIDRARFIEELKKRNIGTSVHFIPLHIHPYYRETYGYQPHDFPVAYREYQRKISLPKTTSTMSSKPSSMLPIPLRSDPSYSSHIFFFSSFFPLPISYHVTFR